MVELLGVRLRLGASVTLAQGREVRRKEGRRSASGAAPPLP